MLNLALQFKEFVKNPVLAFTFLALVAVSYLYFDNKMVYESQITRQEQRIDKLEKPNTLKHKDVTSREALTQKVLIKD